MKSPKIKGIGEVATEYGAKVMKVIKKGLLGRSLFDFYGDVKTNALRVKESSSIPLTPNDKDGGVVYVKNADGKLYYKSNEVAEVELSAHTGLSTEEVQDIAGALVATGGTKTGIAVTYQDATGDVDFVVDHDAATNFVAEEHVDWAASGAGTIHTDNYIENVVQTTITGNAGTATALTSGNKTINGDLSITGSLAVDGSNANINLNAGSDIVLEADNAGGSGASSIQYLDAGGVSRIILAANSDVAILSNRAANGTVQIRANTSSAGGGGEVTVATFEDDKVTISQDLDVAGNVLPGITYIKILPSDFIADDGGRPLAINDSSSDRWLESHGTNPMFASVEIPLGFKATHVHIYGDGTSAMTVSEADVNSRSVTSKGTGNIGTNLAITNVIADATNYILIHLVQTSGEQVNGGKMTIEKA